MTSSRPYRPAMSRDKALAIIQEQIGSQFDPDLSRHFLDLGRRGVLDHVIGHSDEGIPLQHCPVCGPTLVVRRDQQSGEHICCRNCGGEFALAAELGQLMAHPTGRRASPEDLQPDADHELIRRVVSEAVDSMPLEEMLAIDRPQHQQHRDGS